MKIPVNGIHLHVHESGAGGLAVVFLHHYGGSSRTWSEVTPHLEGDFRCIAPDLRGFGDSDAPETGYSVDENTDDIEALLSALKVERFVLVGHSMGGKIALNFASRRPSGLERMVLFAPSPPTPEPMEDSERKRLFDGYGNRASAEETVRLITANPLPPALHELAVADILRSSRPAWEAWLQAGSREDISSRMASIQVPVSVVAGARDAGMSAEMLRREVVARIEGATLDVTPNAAHLLPLEAPRAVADFIRGNEKNS